MRNKPGSALIFVSILVAFVGIIVMLFARSATLYYAFTIDRMQHTRTQCALEAVAQYGVARCIAKEKPIKREWSTQLQAWPVPDGPYQAKVAILKKDSLYQIKSELIKNNKTVGKIECIVRPEGENGAFIEKWTHS
jgi:hypothetical protein